MRKAIKFLLTAGLTGLLLWLLLRRTDPAEVGTILARAEIRVLLAALMVSLSTNCVLAALRWRFILRRMGLEIGLAEAFMIKMGSAPLKSVLPLRAGEAGRVLYLKRRHGFSAVKGTASILLELGSNILVFIALILGGGVICGADPGGSRLPLLAVLAVSAGTALVLSPRSTRRFLRAAAAKIPSARVRGALDTLFSLPRFFRPLELGGLFAFSLLIQSGKLLSFYLAARSLGISYSPATYLVALPFSILLATIPVTILGIGLRENTLAELIPLYNPLAGESAIVGSALLLSLLEYVFPVLLGLFWTRRFLSGLASRKLPEEDTEA